MTVEGAADANVFEAFVQKVLAPTLSSGDIVVMDNLSTHKVPRIIRSIEQTGARVLFLPAYSPDLNPIEKMWSKVKEFLRATKARTAEALLIAIAAALNTVTPQDAVGWFASCGYRII
jgi:transposase